MRLPWEDSRRAGGSGERGVSRPGPCRLLGQDVVDEMRGVVEHLAFRRTAHVNVPVNRFSGGESGARRTPRVRCSLDDPHEYPCCGQDMRLVIAMSSCVILPLR